MIENSNEEQIIEDEAIINKLEEPVKKPVEESSKSTTGNEIEQTTSNENESLIIENVMDSIEEINEKIEEMNKLFVQKIQKTTYEEKIVDQMHSELQKYKEDMYSQLVRPILLDIIEIRDSIIRMSNVFATKPEKEQNVPLKTFRDYSYDIQDVLEKNNITIYNSKDGDEFNALKQRVIKKVTTSVEELHGKIAESLSSGYDYNGSNISPEKVAVYIYQEPHN